MERVPHPACGGGFVTRPVIPVSPGPDRPVTTTAEIPPLRVIEFAACEGGATAGLQRAGCHVTAVDVDAAALARNPADEKIHADALTIDPAWVAENFDAAWA